MKIGKPKRKTTRPDVIPVILPKPQPIPAPDIFKPKQHPVPIQKPSVVEGVNHD